MKIVLSFMLFIACVLVVTEARITRVTRQLDRATAECVRKCPSTNEYNPVCGSDGNTYSNQGKLDCARERCNKDVQFVRRGACATQS